jgi:hypothetical protein
VRVAEAKAMVLDLMSADLAVSGLPVVLKPASPYPRDPSKFTIDGRTARPVHYWDGWMVPVNVGWFDGGFDEPRISGDSFYWYVFAIPRGSRYSRDHYMICDYLQMRDWVLQPAT